MISSGSSNQTIDTTDRPHVNDFSVQTPNRIYRSCDYAPNANCQLQDISYTQCQSILSESLKSRLSIHHKSATRNIKSVNIHIFNQITYNNKMQYFLCFVFFVIQRIHIVCNCTAQCNAVHHHCLITHSQLSVNQLCRPIVLHRGSLLSHRYKSTSNQASLTLQLLQAPIICCSIELASNASSIAN